MTIDAIIYIQGVAKQAGVYAGCAITRLEQLHPLVIPVLADLEEAPLLGFTMGRPADAPPSREHPAYVTLHSGTTREQERLAYAYLAAWLLTDGRGCSAPLPPRTADALQALPDDERSSWLHALALLIPPDFDPNGLAPAETTRLLQVPEPLLALYMSQV